MMKTSTTLLKELDKLVFDLNQIDDKKIAALQWRIILRQKSLPYIKKVLEKKRLNES